MTPIDLDKIKEAAGKATPGPWRWEINLKHKSMSLNGGSPKEGYGRFDLDVLQFARWGMQSACARFRDARGMMHEAQDYAAPVAGREHHADWFQTLDHPDANHIAACHPQTILSLVAVVEAALLFRTHSKDDEGVEMYSACNDLDAALSPFGDTK